MRQQLQTDEKLIIFEATRCRIREEMQILNTPWHNKLSKIEFVAS